MTSAPLYYWAHQAQPSRRFDVGEDDEQFLGSKDQFYPPNQMSGPIRRPDKTVEVITFMGRLTRGRATFELPYRALGSPLQIRIRCHRFGLEGTVSLVVNGEAVSDFVFTDRSYPWGGIETVIPQEVAEKGGQLRIEVVTSGGLHPPSHLPDDLGLGVDWIEIEPMSRGVRLIPASMQWVTAYGLMLLGWFIFRTAGFSFSGRVVLAYIQWAILCMVTALVLDLQILIVSAGHGGRAVLIAVYDLHCSRCRRSDCFQPVGLLSDSQIGLLP